MEEIRQLTKSELTLAARLSDRVFRDDEQKSMADAFPQAFSFAVSHSVGMFVDGSLVSFTGLVPSVIIIGAARLNVFSIGSVCTHPDHRGRGYAGRIVSYIKAHARESNASILLVSGNGPLYSRAGCRDFGKVHHLSISRGMAEALVPPPRADLVLRRMEKKDAFTLHSLSRTREVRYEQSIWDLYALIEAAPTASNMKLEHQVWVAESKGELLGFVVAAVPSRGKAKCDPMVVEWSGETEVISALASHVILQENMDVIHWHVPAHEYQSGMEPFAHSVGRQNGTVCVVDAERLLIQLSPYFKEKAAVHSRSLAWFKEDEFFTFSHGRKKWRLTDADLIPVLFDPAECWPVQEDSRDAMLDFFPVPFPYTGGLNYV
jgi:predicted N-acetyltransferase YhbS